MTRQFIKKEGMALTLLARYLLGEQVQNRLRTIDDLSRSFKLSVGVVQNGLKVLEQQGVVTLERRGRNGTIILSLDYQGLFSQAGINNLVCAMALPYTKLYEGLASGLKAQFQQVPLYFAHMHGADVRIQCLLDGIYDIAIVSRLAAESYLQQGVVDVALNLGPHSYVSAHQLICRQEQQHHIRRVGIDVQSPDQRLLTNIYFANQPIELVNISYHEGVKLIEKGIIDAMIWSPTEQLADKNLISIPLIDNPIYQQASEAVILTKQGNNVIKQLVNRIINLTQLLAHQQAVQAGLIDPSY